MIGAGHGATHRLFCNTQALSVRKLVGRGILQPIGWDATTTLLMNKPPRKNGGNRAEHRQEQCGENQGIFQSLIEVILYL